MNAAGDPAILIGAALLVAGGLAAAFLVLGRVGRSLEALGDSQIELRAQLGSLRQDLDRSAGSLVQQTFRVQEVLQRDMAKAHELVVELRAELGARRRRDEEIERAVRHLERVLAGSAGKGAAGEGILDEAFAAFPPEMVERNFRVRGKVVEYALVLWGGARRMPIDSKWPASDALERLTESSDPDERRRAVGELRAELRRKVREVAQYLDPLVTTDKAVAAVPDAVYPHCGELAFEAFRQGVIIMPYSMTVPYVLNLYNLHLKYSQSISLDVLADALSDIGRNIDALEKSLEDRLRRGATMVGNAYDDALRIAAQIRRTLEHVRALPSFAEQAGVAAGRDDPETGP